MYLPLKRPHPTLPLTMGRENGINGEVVACHPIILPSYHLLLSSHRERGTIISKRRRWGHITWRALANSEATWSLSPAGKGSVKNLNASSCRAFFGTAALKNLCLSLDKPRVFRLALPKNSQQPDSIGVFNRPLAKKSAFLLSSREPPFASLF